MLEPVVSQLLSSKTLSHVNILIASYRMIVSTTASGISRCRCDQVTNKLKCQIAISFTIQSFFFSVVRASKRFLQNCPDF